MLMTDSPTVRRRQLGAALRRLREGAGLSLDDAANVLECGRSKISRIETGHRGIRPKELRELLTEYGIDQERQAALLEVARHSALRGWWNSYGNVLSETYRDYISLEASASAIWTYEAQYIPGLLQTEAYARAVAASSLVKETPDEQATFVKVRLERQQVITSTTPLDLWAVVSEAALRQMVGGAKVMREQLAHLVELANRLPNITIQVLPFAVGAHAGTSGPFVILKFPESPELGVVYLEGQTGGIYLETTNDCERYALVFDHLRASALPTETSVHLIESMAKDL